MQAAITSLSKIQQNQRRFLASSSLKACCHDECSNFRYANCHKVLGGGDLSEAGGPILGATQLSICYQQQRALYNLM